MIEKLVSDLPEIYQPIYGRPELSGQISRPCHDRLERIERIYDTLQRQLGRPLSVLDLGCAQGYFSLNLAERGAKVHGVDYLDKNIAVCNALAQAHPQLQASFETGRVEDVIARLEPGCYDLVLGLSVFHHIVHEKGAEAVKALLERVANHCGALIVELALREEPLYWAPAQPEDPRTLLEPIAFVHEVARHATHLAPIPRPLFVASNRYWILEDRAELFNSWSADPHALAHGTHEGSRRYFFSDNCILKLYRFDHSRGEFNKAEFKRDVQFVQNPPTDFPSVALISFGETDAYAWLATQRLSGRLLLDLLREGVAIDSRAVLLAVLGQLAALEKVGLYHDDVRTWNVLVAEDGATHVIDYGSISDRAQDCVWPGNPFLSFFIFVREVTTGVVDDPNPLRTISISPYGLPQPYRTWATALWQRPLAEWSFGLMHQTLLEMPADKTDEPLQQPIEAWMKAMEDGLQAKKLFTQRLAIHLEAQALQASERAASAEAQAQQASERAASAEAQAQQAGERAASAEAQALQASERATLAEAQAQQASERAASAEAQAQQASERATSAEFQAQQASERAASAEAQALQASERATSAEAQAQQAGERATSAEAHAQQASERAASAEAQAQQASERAVNAESALTAVHNSSSWRLTAPLRMARRIVNTFSQAPKNLKPSIKTKAKLLLAHASLYVNRRPKLKHAALAVLARFPTLKARLKVATVNRTFAEATAPTVSADLANLTPRARQIYVDLKAAIERRQKESS